MERKFVFSFNENYHLYNRGVEKRIIFQDTDDYERFITLLDLANDKVSVNLRETKKETKLGIKNNHQKEAIVDIGAWCLMPNHFHILIHEKEEGGISKFMLKLLTGYTMYFNKKYQRKGRLFETTFQARHTNSDNYLKYLYSYIHLNPIKLIQPDWRERGIGNIDQAFSFLDSYKYSSYADYLGFKRKENSILNKTVFPDYLSDAKSFRSELVEWLNFDPDKIIIG